jgi:precorrin-6B methylase 2
MLAQNWMVTLVLLLFEAAFTAAAAPPATPALQAPSAPAYEWRTVHDPDGSGKFYRGREIALVMGHQGADWLERPEREAEERPDLLLNLLDLKPGEKVADVGAGSGYLSWRLATRVANRGRVYAVDVQAEMLDLLRQKMAERKITNVVPVLGTITNALLPAQSVDLALMVDVYHEFSHPAEMMSSICQALKKGGRVVLVEYRAEDPEVPIKPVHKMSEAQVRREMSGLPIKWVKTIEELPRQHVIFFEKTE